MMILYEKERKPNTKAIDLRVLLSGCRQLVRSKYVWHYKANTLHLFARVKICLNTEPNPCYIFSENRVNNYIDNIT